LTRGTLQPSEVARRSCRRDRSELTAASPKRRRVGAVEWEDKHENTVVVLVKQATLHETKFKGASGGGVRSQSNYAVRPKHDQGLVHCPRAIIWLELIMHLARGCATPPNSCCNDGRSEARKQWRPDSRHNGGGSHALTQGFRIPVNDGGSQAQT
jgi:hypothetical protein